MNQDRPAVTPLTGPSFHGTYEQIQTIQTLESKGWIFLHWTEIPLVLAAMENTKGDIFFIDYYGDLWSFGRT